MKVSLDLQLAARNQSFVPDKKKLLSYIKAALDYVCYKEDCELTVRMADPEEVRDLNKTYRNMDKATNILSFPFEAPKEAPLPLLGDLVICTEVLIKEAHELNLDPEEHMAHLAIHGTLHLLGYDHIKDDEAALMEGIETKVMLQLGFEDPYCIADEKENL